MKHFIIVLFLLISFSAFTQNSFSFRELQDIYLSNDKNQAIRSFESKGYTPASADDFRELFGTDVKGILYSRTIDASKIGIEFRDNKIYGVIFMDSIASINSLLHEAEKTDFVLTHQEGEICKGYVKKRTSYFVWYSVLNEMSVESSMISIMKKSKANKILRNPNR